MKSILYVCLPAVLMVTGCLSGTTAEDPIPGPLQDAGIIALESGENLQVNISALVEGSVSEVIPWFNDRVLMEKWLAEEVQVDRGEESVFRLAWPSAGIEIKGRVVEQGLDRWQAVECELEPYAGLDVTHLKISAEQEAPGYTRIRLQQWPFRGGAEGEAAAQTHLEGWSRALTVLRSAVGSTLPTTPAPPPM
ncbi:MAG: hypothetical protein V2A76_14935 [Planctomycetota bacterium]